MLVEGVRVDDDAMAEEEGDDDDDDNDEGPEAAPSAHSLPPPTANGLAPSRSAVSPGEPAGTREAQHAGHDRYPSPRCLSAWMRDRTGLLAQTP